MLRWQARKMGLLEIGYHLIIDREGYIHRIRDVLCIGSHCPSYNHTSVGVCLLGGLDEEGTHTNNFTEAQGLLLLQVAAAFQREWPSGVVRGHNELPGYRTDRFKCPSLDMHALRHRLAHEPDNGPKLTEMIPNRRSPKNGHEHQEHHATGSPDPGLPHE